MSPTRLSQYQKSQFRELKRRFPTLTSERAIQFADIVLFILFYFFFFLFLSSVKHTHTHTGSSHLLSPLSGFTSFVVFLTNCRRVTHIQSE